MIFNTYVLYVNYMICNILQWWINNMILENRGFFRKFAPHKSLRIRSR